MCVRCMYGCLSRERTKFTVLYNVHTRFWPSLLICTGALWRACQLEVHTYTLELLKYHHLAALLPPLRKRPRPQSTCRSTMCYALATTTSARAPIKKRTKQCKMFCQFTCAASTSVRAPTKNMCMSTICYVLPTTLPVLLPSLHKWPSKKRLEKCIPYFFAKSISAWAPTKDTRT